MHRKNIPVLYCTVLYCTVLYCTVLYCTVLYCTVLYCTVLYCTVLYCTVLYCTVLYCTVLYCTVLYCNELYCTVPYCTVPYSLLYCIVTCHVISVVTSIRFILSYCYLPVIFTIHTLPSDIAMLSHLRLDRKLTSEGAPTRQNSSSS